MMKNKLLLIFSLLLALNSVSEAQSPSCGVDVDADRSFTSHDQTTGYISDAVAMYTVFVYGASADLVIDDYRTHGRLSAAQIETNAQRANRLDDVQMLNSRKGLEVQDLQILLLIGEGESSLAVFQQYGLLETIEELKNAFRRVERLTAGCLMTREPR